MTRIFFSSLYCFVSLGLCSCNTSKNITGKYGTNFASMGFFGTTVILKHDKTLDYKFSGDMVFHRVTGTYKISDHKIYMLFDKEILDTNFAKAPLFEDTIKTLTNKRDTINYHYFLYIGHNKLFFSLRQTGTKVIKAKRYNKRKKYILFGSHYYKRRWYLRKID